MLALMLVNARLDPTCEIGAIVPSLGVNYRIGQSVYFVNEADEFNNNFWHYHPRLAVVTSIEFEHPEFFAHYSEYLASFEHFVRGMDSGSDWPFPPTLIVNHNSAGCHDLLARLEDWPGRILTYAVEEQAGATPRADFVACNLKLDGETSFQVWAERINSRLGGQVVHLQLPGAHNVENALAALSAATIAGVDPAVPIKSIESFGGTRRRCAVR